MSDIEILNDSKLINKIDYKLLEIFDRVPYPVEIIDLEGRFVFLNSSYRKNLNTGNVLGKTIFEVYKDETDTEKTRNYFLKMLDGSVKPEKYIDSFFDEQGNLCGYQIDWDYIRENDGDIIGFIVALSDISASLETKRLYEEKNNILKVQKASMDNMKIKMQMALEAANEGIWEWDLKSDTVSYDDRYFEMLGYEREDFLDIDNVWGYLVHPDDKETYNIDFGNFMNAMTDKYQFQYRMKSKYDGWKWILDKGQVIRRDRAGNPEILIGIHMDITEIMEKKQEVERLKEELETSMEVSNINEWIFDFEKDEVSGVYEWMRFFHHINSCPSVGKSKIDTWCNSIHPDDRMKVFKKLESSITGINKIFNVEYRIRSGKGYIWFSDAGKVIKRDKEGNPVYMVGTRKDITTIKKKEMELFDSKEEVKKEKKRTDELNKKLTLSNRELMNTKHILEYVLKNARIGVWEWDIKNDKVKFNEIAMEMLGMNLENTLSMSKWEELIFEEDRKRIADTMSSYLNSTITEYMVQYRIVTGESKMIWVQENGEIIEFDDLGIPSLFVGSIMDITVQKEIEELLINAKEDAEKASKLKSDLISNVNHELRTPLTVIMGMTQTLLSMEDDSEKSEFLEQILDSSQRLLILINDVLDISKMESGKLVLNEEKFNLKKVLNNFSRGLCNQANMKGIKYILDISENIPDEVILDKGKILQVLNNLMGNAIKFTEKGYVSLNVFSTDDKRINFEVKDTGIGIPEGKQHEVFKQFYQVDSSNKRKFGGTGLGLSIVSNLAKIMNGEIKLESVFGKGSVFTFSVPLKF